MVKPPLTLLCIIDGFGINPNPEANAVFMAKKPNIDQLMKSCPVTSLITHGTAVGLPAGHMGNSEVGHLNIGAGRVVLQWLTRITHDLKSDYLDRSASYLTFKNSVKTTATVHLVGLFSQGGVHSESEHLYNLCNRLLKDGYKKIALHLISDGRDTAPRILLEDLKGLNEYVNHNPGVSIASLSGRFYAMDRDKRSERTEKAFSVIFKAKGPTATTAERWATDQYNKGINDEFLEPVVIAPAALNPEDGVVFWNFRADRMRQITRALCDPGFVDFNRGREAHPKDKVLCFTNYDPTLKLPYLWEPVTIKHHLGAVVSESGLLQLRTAETEKYPHVTYFFNGGIEEAFPNEDRKLIPSPRDVKTYDLKPEMSAYGVKDLVIEGIRSGKYQFIVVNFANCDMVGHTGVLEAAIKAVETVDSCLGEIISELKKVNGQALIIADHGNCEQMINYETGAPHTSHTTYPVPAILFGYSAKLREGGALSDVAPTILQIMGLKQPKEMTGKSLIV